MPVDMDGNRADIVLDPISTIKRMNLGRLYESYVSGAVRDVTKEIRRRLGVEQKLYSIDYLADLNPTLIKSVYDYLLSFYEVTSPKQFNFFKNLNDNDRLEHLSVIIKEGIKLYMPIDNQLNNVDIVKNIQRLFNPTYGPVRYVGNSGKPCMTVDNVRIAPMYIMLLNKTPDEWSAVSTGRLQHLGLLSSSIKSENYTFPYRNSAIKAWGETEMRIVNGYTGPENVSEIIDRNNNPHTMSIMYRNMLLADKPSNVDNLVDRSIYPLGNAKNIQVVKHSLMVTGIELVYEPED